jgi:prevent-host-death family protein
MVSISIINIAEAKAKLSELVARAANGEEIVLARHGQPMARLVPLEEVVEPAPDRGFGVGRGDFVIGDDFDAPLPQHVVADFEQSALFPK